MKKPKISLDKEKLQQFFLLHVEKILLVVIVGLMALLIYRGFSLPHLENSLSPQALVEKTRGAKQYIDDPNRWNEVSGTRPVEFDVVKKVGDVQKPSDPMAYMLVNTWSRPDFPKLSPREDPVLFPPEKLIVRPVVGPLASYPRSEDEYKDPLFPQKSEDQLRAERNKAKAEEKKKKKAEELAGGPGGEGGMPARPARGKKLKGGEEGGEMAGSTRGGGRMPGGYGMGGGEYGQNPGGLYPEAASVGYIPQNPEQTIARNVASVTIMAVVPIQRQTEEFDKKFTNSLDFDPRRDAPYYMEYRVQRADVTAVDPATEADKLPWENLPAPSRVLAELFGDERTPGLYAGIPTEVADPTYLAEALTHPAPPYLARDLWDLLTHPDVPLAAVNPAYAEGAAGAIAAAGGGGPDDDAPSVPSFGAPGMPGMPGLPGMAGAPGGGEGGIGGMAGMGGMRPGLGRMGSGEGGMPGGMGGMGGMRSPAMMPRPGGMGGMAGSGEGGMGGYGMNMPTYTPPKHQLIRFTDINVRPGHKYRYRLRVMVHDPNHPMLGVTPPTAASLAETVRKRVKDIDTADAAKPKNQQTGLPARTYWLWTPWSEPSPIAEVPHGERVFASKVTQCSLMRVKNLDVPGEPAASALALVFDHSKVADVPGETIVGRGYVLNFPLEGKDKAPKIIHPVTKEVVELDKYMVTTNVMVADLMGGEPIRPIVTGSASQALTGIGEMLVMDADGKLHVRNEADDIVQIRRYTVPKEDKTKKATPDTAGGLEGGMPGRRPGRATD